MIDYEENLLMIMRTRGSVIPKAILYSLPSAVVAVGILFFEEQYVRDLRQTSGLSTVSQSFMWGALTFVIGGLLTFRTKQALGRFWEGTSLLHQMRGEWFDASSCLMTFSRDGKVNKGKVAEVDEFRHTLLRLMSLMHASALDEISASTDNNHYEVLDIHGLDVNTLKFLRDCKESGFNRVETLQHMIQVLVTHNHHAGIITIPPPILSRIYQTLSRGLVNLLNARKIKDTMFPFPYAQIITLLIIIQTLLTPVMMANVIERYTMAALMSFLPSFGMWCLNFVAVELEMPFGLDDNDLPLRHFQQEMNASLLMLIHDMADHMPHTSAHCVKEFETLKTYIMEDCTVQGIISNSAAFMHPVFFECFEHDATTPTEPTIHPPVLEPENASPRKLSEVKVVDQVKIAEPVKPITLPLPAQEEKSTMAQISIPYTLQGVPTLVHSLEKSGMAMQEISPYSSASIPYAMQGLPTLVQSLQKTPVPMQEPYSASIEDDVPDLPPVCPDPCPRISKFDGVIDADKLDVDKVDVDKLASLDRIYREWAQRIDIQVSEMRRNTECTSSFAKSLPVMIAEHSAAFTGFTEAILRRAESAGATKVCSDRHGDNAYRDPSRDNV